MCVQAYLLSMYFDCPQFAGFHCPTEAAKEVEETVLIKALHCHDDAILDRVT